MAANDERSARSEQVIQVSGTGIVSVPPDLASVTLGVQLSGPELAPLQAGVRESIQTITDAMKDASVQASRIHTAFFQIHPMMHHDGTLMYQVSHMLEARFGELGRAGEIIDGALAAGANIVQGVRFLVEDASAARRLARERAVSEARERAEHLAALAGLRIGPPIYISEGVVGGPARPMMKTFYSRAAGSTAAPTTIDPGESDIVVSVEVIYPIIASAD